MLFTKEQINELMEICTNAGNCGICTKSEFCSEVEAELSKCARYDCGSDPEEYTEEIVEWLTT